MNARALVTGGSGFLGAEVVGRLAAEGRDPLVVDLRRSERAPTIEADLAAAPPELPEGPIGEVYHLAGLAHTVPRTEEESRRFFDVNLGGTIHLLQALDRLPAPPGAVVLVSTVAVYGRECGEHLDEETPTAAEDPYGLSKLEAELAVREWASERGVRVGIVRLPLVAGPGAPGNLGAMIDALRRGRYLGIGSGAARRSMVLATDVASALPAVAAAGGVYHLTDGHHPSFRELEGAICAALGRRRPVRMPLALMRLGGIVGDAAGRVGVPLPVSSRVVSKMTSTLTFDDGRARREIGWRPRRVLDLAEEIVG